MDEYNQNYILISKKRIEILIKKRVSIDLYAFLLLFEYNLQIREDNIIYPENIEQIKKILRWRDDRLIKTLKKLEQLQIIKSV